MNRMSELSLMIVDAYRLNRGTTRTERDQREGTWCDCGSCGELLGYLQCLLSFVMGPLRERRATRAIKLDEWLLSLKLVSVSPSCLSPRRRRHPLARRWLGKALQRLALDSRPSRTSSCCSTRQKEPISRQLSTSTSTSSALVRPWATRARRGSTRPMQLTLWRGCRRRCSS